MSSYQLDDYPFFLYDQQCEVYTYFYIFGHSFKHSSFSRLLAFIDTNNQNIIIIQYKLWLRKIIVELNKPKMSVNIPLIEHWCPWCCPLQHSRSKNFTSISYQGDRYISLLSFLLFISLRSLHILFSGVSQIVPVFPFDCFVLFSFLDWDICSILVLIMIVNDLSHLFLFIHSPHEFKYFNILEFSLLMFKDRLCLILVSWYYVLMMRNVFCANDGKKNIIVAALLNDHFVSSFY